MVEREVGGRVSRGMKKTHGRNHKRPQKMEVEDYILHLIERIGVSMLNRRDFQFYIEDVEDVPG